MILYDRSTLYAAFRAFDPDPTAIRTYLKDRDQAVEDDWVGLVLDTFNDERRAFDFRVNPLGIQMDGILTNDDADFSLDVIWSSAGQIHDWVMSILADMLASPNDICSVFHQVNYGTRTRRKPL